MLEQNTKQISEIDIDTRINMRAGADQERVMIEHAAPQPREMDAALTTEDEFQAARFRGFVELGPTKAEGLDELIAKYSKKPERQNGNSAGTELKPGVPVDPNQQVH